MSNPGWVGFDLDGTLAIYDGWKGFEHIGSPIASIVDIAKSYIESNITIKIFTARATCEESIKPIQDWCEEHGLGRPEVTATKDFNMICFYDDRAIGMIANSGKICDPRHIFRLIKKLVDNHLK